MELVVESGTATIAKIPGISVCGKTGTAENFAKIGGVRTKLEDHSIFVAFAPKENPKIAIAVFVENAGFGAQHAAPIARKALDFYLEGKWPKEIPEWKRAP